MGDDLAARFAALGAEVDHPVCGGDEVEVVLDDQHSVATFDQALQHFDQAAHIGHMQADRWLLEEEEVLFGVGLEAGSVVTEAAQQVGDEPDALGFAATESGAGLAEFEIAEAGVTERLKRPKNFWYCPEKTGCLIYA